MTGPTSGRFPRASSVPTPSFFLTCRSRRASRESGRASGKAREDLPWQETKLDPEFVSYVRRFPDEQLPRIRELLDARPSGAGSSSCAPGKRPSAPLVPGGLLWKLANPVSQLDT